MFRVFVPLVLLAVAVSTLLVSNQLTEEPAPGHTLGVTEAEVPLLSARRLPAVTTSVVPVTVPRREVTLERDLTALALNAPAQSCVIVRQDGEDLFVKDPDEPLTPASLQKLATAQAALLALGPDYTYRTTAIAQDLPAGGVLGGDLYLLGGGDPLLATVEYAALLEAQGAEPTVLDDLAADLTAEGLTRIEGGVIAVAHRYDDAGSVDSWPAEWVAAGDAGTLNPVALNQGYQTPEGILATAGLLPEPEPAIRTAVLFDDMLEARDVRIPHRPGTAAPDEDFSDYVELGWIESAPLSSYLRFMLSESDNTTAELLLKEIGLAWSGTGSTIDGAVATLALLSEEAERTLLVFQPADGSGLSPQNQLTCRQAADILEIGGPDGGALGSYLPVVGESGTVRYRFADSTAVGRVRAKTGSLPGVSSLAGFATGSDGRPITFAAILNGETLAAVDADAFLQQLLEILVSHPSYAEVG